MSNLAARRMEYPHEGLEENDLAPDPFHQFDRWFQAASAAGIIEPNAMILSTTDPDGAPTGRTVLLKGMDERGFVFYTNLESRKGQALAANPRASLVFPWLALGRQVMVTGAVTRVSRETTDAYFQSRPRGSQLGAWASPQSTPVPDRPALEAHLESVKERYDGQEVPTPPHWGGYRVIPATIEFWQGRRNRLHDRLRYRRDGDAWTIERLAP